MVITARTRNAVTEQSVQGFESLRFRQQALTNLVRAFVLYTQGMRTRGFDTCANRGDPAGVSVASLRFRQQLATPCGRKTKQFTQRELPFVFLLFACQLEFSGTTFGNNPWRSHGSLFRLFAPCKSCSLRQCRSHSKMRPSYFCFRGIADIIFPTQIIEAPTPTFWMMQKRDKYGNWTK